MRERLAILGMSILAAVTYGVVHDQITARLCVEYFSIFHPHLINSQSPTLLGLAWGVAATWWVGAILGVPLAIAARIGRAPKIAPAGLIVPLTVMLSATGACAAVAGVVGYGLARSGVIANDADLMEFLPHLNFNAYIAVSFVHVASYFGGAIAGIALVVWTVVRRTAMARAAAAEQGGAAPAPPMRTGSAAAD